MKYPEYEYGPKSDFNIETDGTVKEQKGAFSQLDKDEKRLLQVLCHMIYQIKDDIKSSRNGILNLGKSRIHWLPTKLGEEYSLYTDDMITVFRIIETGCYSFVIEFISPDQLMAAKTLDDYAYNHRLEFGRAE